jgi:hypothetical protein
VSGPWRLISLSFAAKAWDGFKKNAAVAASSIAEGSNRRDGKGHQEREDERTSENLVANRSGAKIQHL